MNSGQDLSRSLSSVGLLDESFFFFFWKGEKIGMTKNNDNDSRYRL